MSHSILRSCRPCLLVAALFALGVQLAAAGSAPLFSGSYEVVKTTALGSQAQVRMRIHLVNHGAFPLAIQTMALRGFSHANRGATHACAVALAAYASTETTQEFIILRPEYQLWQKGLRPRLVLQIGPPGGAKSTAVVRLDKISGQEAK